MTKLKKVIVGIDEVGRGPFAGPMVIAAVGGIPEEYLEGIRDSKKLSEKKREAWYEKIKTVGECYYVSVPPETIDEHGISKSAKTAVKQLLAKFGGRVDKVMLDGGLYAPDTYEQETIVRGDDAIPIISAASVYVKVTRDRMMHALDKKYPGYELARHKGYGTAAHIAAIKKYGLSDIHRKTFCRNIRLD